MSGEPTLSIGISGDFAQTKAQIIQYLQERREREATVAFADQLRRASTVQINLTSPVSPAHTTSTRPPR